MATLGLEPAWTGVCVAPLLHVRRALTLPEDRQRTGLCFSSFSFFPPPSLSFCKVERGGPHAEFKDAEEPEFLCCVDEPRPSSSGPLPPLPCKQLPAREPLTILVRPREWTPGPGCNRCLLSDNLKPESVESVALGQSEHVREPRQTGPWDSC